MSGMRLAFPFSVAAICAICAANIWAAGPPDGFDVTVVNTPSQPIPVIGTIGVSGGVTINNPASAPVPVSIAPSAPEPSVTCTAEFGSEGPSPTPFLDSLGAPAASSGPLSIIKCPTGVNGVKVKRVVYDPDGTATSNPIFVSKMVATYRTILGFTPANADRFDTSTTVIAMLTNGSPEKAVDPPITLMMNGAGRLLMKRSCTSGIAGFFPTCGGIYYLIGAPLQ